MKKIYSYLFIFLLTATVSYGEVVDRIVAVVNDSIVTLSELEESLEDESLKEDRLEMENALDKLIEVKLLRQASDKAGVDVSETEVEAAIDDVLTKNKMTIDELMRALIKEGISFDNYKKEIEDSIRQAKFSERVFASKVKIKEEDVENYYLQNRDVLSGPPEYKIKLMILKGTSKDAKLEAVNDGLTKGVSFGELVKEFSDGPAVSDGGDMGFLKEGEISPEIEAQSLKLSKGEVSKPFKFKDQIVLVKLIDTRAGQMAEYESLKRQLFKKLYEQVAEDRYKEWLKDIKDSAHIEIRL